MNSRKYQEVILRLSSQFPFFEEFLPKLAQHLGETYGQKDMSVEELEERAVIASIIGYRSTQRTMERRAKELQAD